MDWEAGGIGSAGHAHGEYATALAAGRCRQLLVTSSTANLQQLPAVLQRMQCFHAAFISDQHHRLLLSAAGHQAGHAVQQLPAHPADGSAAGDSVLDLVFLRPRELLAVLASNSKHTLDCLEELLLGAMRVLPGVSMARVACCEPACAHATSCTIDRDPEYNLHVIT
jgi:hypothetical protein